MRSSLIRTTISLVLMLTTTAALANAFTPLLSQAGPSFPDDGLWRKSITETRHTRNELEIAKYYDFLTGDEQDWETNVLIGQHRFRKERSLYWSIHDSDRFSLEDKEYSLGIIVPKNAWDYLLNMSWSPTHKATPNHSIEFKTLRLVSLALKMGMGFGDFRYNHINATNLYFLAEKQLYRYRFNYVGQRAHITGNNIDDSPVYHTLTATYNISIQNDISLKFARGEQLLYDGSVTPPIGRAQTVQLMSHYRVNKGLILNLMLGQHLQDDVNDRYGLYLGFRRFF